MAVSSVFTPRRSPDRARHRPFPDGERDSRGSGNTESGVQSPASPHYPYVAALALATILTLLLSFSSLAHSAGDNGAPSLTPIGGGARSHWQRGLASSYGPGLYGNGTACGQTLTPSTRGVAHRSLRCGTRLRICQGGRCTHARVIDRGPYSGARVLDLTAATTRELCRCSPYQWGERSVGYREARL